MQSENNAPSVNVSTAPEEVDFMLADTLVLKYDIELAEERAKIEANVKARIEANVEKRIQTSIAANVRNMARNLKSDGVPAETIARNLGLPISEVENL